MQAINIEEEISNYSINNNDIRNIEKLKDQKLEEFSNLPGFTPIHTSVPTVETFPVHEEDISDWIFYKDYPDTVEKNK